RLWRIGVDRPVAEVADEQVAAEAAEVAWRHRQPPRSVQLATRGDARDEGPVCRELVDEAEALSGHLVMASALLRVGDEQVAADVLDPERPIPRGEARVDERHDDGVKASVEDVDVPIDEVGRIEEVARADRA